MTPLTRWDARWKLAAILIACVIIACLRTEQAAAAALGIALATAAVARVRPRKIADRLALIALSLLPFLIVLPFEWDADRGILFSRPGFDFALTLALRAFAIGVLALVLVTSAPLDRLIVAAQKLGLPAPLTRIVLLTHRYAQGIVDEVRRLRIAWRVRGFRPATNLRTYRTYAYGLGAVLVRSGERGEVLAAAMRARGYDGRYRSLTPFRTTPVDVLAAGLLIASLLALAVWERLA